MRSPDYQDIDWATTLHQGIAEIRKLKDHPRIRTIAVNPLRPKTADVVGSRWMPVRAGTDAALMLGMMYVLITENRLDRAFLANCVTGWNEMEAYILGTEDGVKRHRNGLKSAVEFLLSKFNRLLESFPNTVP